MGAAFTGSTPRWAGGRRSPPTASGCGRELARGTWHGAFRKAFPAEHRGFLASCAFTRAHRDVSVRSCRNAAGGVPRRAGGRGSPVDPGALPVVEARPRGQGGARAYDRALRRAPSQPDRDRHGRGQDRPLELPRSGGRRCRPPDHGRDDAAGRRGRVSAWTGCSGDWPPGSPVPAAHQRASRIRRSARNRARHRADHSPVVPAPRPLAPATRRRMAEPVKGMQAPRGVAQLVEHRSPKPRVAGSSPIAPASMRSFR
jgi:hypothetical protein